MKNLIILTTDRVFRCVYMGPELGDQAGQWECFMHPLLRRADTRGPGTAGGEGSLTPGTPSSPPFLSMAHPDLAYLELPEELGDLSAVQLLAGLLVGTDDLIHGHILGCRHRGPTPLTLHTWSPFFPTHAPVVPSSTILFSKGGNQGPGRESW